MLQGRFDSSQEALQKKTGAVMNDAMSVRTPSCQTPSGRALSPWRHQEGGRLEACCCRPKRRSCPAATGSRVLHRHARNLAVWPCYAAPGKKSVQGCKSQIHTLAMAS